MDTERQIRINFLDEAEDCFDRIESVILGLAATLAEPERLDLALRAAHSVKGGAGMMGFMPLSHLAHRLEDSFKILKVRHQSTQISTEVETLLLQGVDGLRQLGNLHRQGADVDDSWLSREIAPIFDQLQRQLGELGDEDERALLNQDGGAGAELLLFEDEVETILDELERQLAELPPSELPEALLLGAEELMVFGQMADLEPFTRLCQSVQQRAATAGEGEIEALARQALATWRRSHALVARGRLEKLPCQLEFDGQVGEGGEVQALDDLESLELNLAGVEAELAELEGESLAEMASELELLSEAITVAEEAPPPPLSAPVAEPPQPPEKTVQTVRVPVEQLYQFNSLFGNLILERNATNLHLEQLRDFVALMRQRMRQLEQSNAQLRKWYDRASLEGLLTPPSGEAAKGDFDALEMDRYSDLHSISQGQIETIVQLQEVSADIELELHELTQGMRELSQTTRSLQRNVTRTQMLHFADVVKMFPRVVRDLGLQFGKQVNLKVEGEATLIDRALVEHLNAPLTHLLRNAFDHGIESSATRIAAGKPPQGTITLQAANRGTQTIVTVKDDGGGISLTKIGDRLRQMGIPEAEIARMSEGELLNYIFEPGFTTAAEVTELSGRGVGLDVVRTNLREVRGEIQVQTQPGCGTTFTLSLPFTLSILRVMLLERAGIVFAIPLDSIREIQRLTPAEIASLLDLERLTWKGQAIPAFRLEESLIFHRPHKPLEMQGRPAINKPTVLVAGEGTATAGIYLDRVWGEREVSIRPILSPLPLPAGFISSMVLGDGRVIPLVDPVQLLEGCWECDRQRRAGAGGARDSQLAAIREPAKTILIVDDSINVRRYLALTLERAGYQVEQAKDGQEAVDKLSAGLRVQGVICDIEMPRLDGYGVLEEIKAKPEFRQLPIAMLTSRSNEKHRKLAMNLGASAYFSKPYNERELLQTLGNLVGGPSQ